MVITTWGAAALVALICAAVYAVGRLRKRAEAILRESEARFRGLFENSHAVMLVVDAVDGAIVDANPAAVAFYGWPREELARRTLRDINTLPPDQLAVELAAAREGRKARFEFRHRRADGSVRDVEVYAGPVQVAGRRLIYAIVHDISERAEAQAALNRERRFVEALLEHAPIGFAVNTIHDGRPVFVSPTFERIYGLAPGTLQGVDDFFERVYLDPVLREQMRERIMADVASGDRSRMRWDDIPLTTAEGDRRVVTAINVPVVDQDLMISTVQDVTERTRTEAALAESERRVRRVITDSPIPVLMHAEDGEILHISHSWCDITGYDADELKTVADWTERAYGVRKALVQPKIDALFRLDHYTHEGDFTVRTRAGGTRIWEFSSAPLGRLPDGRRLVVSMAMDVTERRGADALARQALADVEASRQVLLSVVEDQKRAEDSLREREAELEKAQEIARLGSWALDVSGRITWSDEMYRIYQVTPESFEPSASTIRPLIHPDDWPSMQAWLRAYVTNESPGELEFRAVLPDGTVRVISQRGEVTRDSEGMPVRVSGTAQDITERRQAEEALRTSLQEKDALLMEVHHRVKNNLQVIMSLLRLEAGRSTQGAVKAAFGEMQNRIMSMALLHETLYHSGNLAQVDLSGYLTQLTMQVFRSVAPSSGVTLDLALAGVRIDLDQAVPCGLLVNELVSNCLKHAFPGGRKGRVRVELHPEDVRTDAPAHGRSFRLTVSDNGVGLPADFDRRRTGSLGLVLVSDLARQLQGTLDIGRDSGASFSLVFVPRESDVSGGIKA